MCDIDTVATTAIYVFSGYTTFVNHPVILISDMHTNLLWYSCFFYVPSPPLGSRECPVVYV